MTLFFFCFSIAYYVLFMFAKPTLAQIPNQVQIAMQFGTGIAFILVNVGWFVFASFLPRYCC
jgi:hypothetical protein